MGLQRVNAFAVGKLSSQHLLSGCELSSRPGPSLRSQAPGSELQDRGSGAGLASEAAQRSNVRVPTETLIGQVCRRPLFQEQFYLNITKNY